MGYDLKEAGKFYLFEDSGQTGGCSLRIFQNGAYPVANFQSLFFAVIIAVVIILCAGFHHHCHSDYDRQHHHNFQHHPHHRRTPVKPRKITRPRFIRPAPASRELTFKSDSSDCQALSVDDEVRISCYTDG